MVLIFVKYVSSYLSNYYYYKLELFIMFSEQQLHLNFPWPGVDIGVSIEVFTHPWKITFLPLKPTENGKEILRIGSPLVNSHAIKSVFSPTTSPQQLNISKQIANVLQATLYTVQNWVESRSAEYIQSWRVGDFFIINHADLARIYPSFDLLQVIYT